jgi:hypothetical protein
MHPGSSRLRQASLTERHRCVRASTWVRGPLLSGGRAARSAESLAALPVSASPRRGCPAAEVLEAAQLAPGGFALHGRCDSEGVPFASSFVNHVQWVATPAGPHSCRLVVTGAYSFVSLLLEGRGARAANQGSCLRLDTHEQHVGLLSRCPYRPPGSTDPSPPARPLLPASFYVPCRRVPLQQPGLGAPEGPDRAGERKGKPLQHVTLIGCWSWDIVWPPSESLGRKLG